MPRRKKNRTEESENLDRWLVSYADFITLLFALFVTMYAISRIDEKKFGSMVDSMQRALGSVIITQMPHREPGIFSNYSNPVKHPEGVGLKGVINERDNFEKLTQEIKKSVADFSEKYGREANSEMDQIKFIIDKRGLVLRFPDQVFFDSGKAVLNQDSHPILEAIGTSLAKIHNQIRIEGHTDSVPIKTSEFPSNWELSTARATIMIRYYLTQFQFDPNRLSAAGYGEYRPIASNETAEGKQKNRRVDVIILSEREEAETEPSYE